MPNHDLDVSVGLDISDVRTSASSLNGILAGIGNAAKVGLLGIGVGVAGIAAGMGALAAGIGATSRIAIDALSSWNEQVDMLSDNLGTTGAQSSAWAVAFQHVGMSVEEGASGLNFFVRALGNSEDALKKAAHTYSVSAQEIASSHADAMKQIADDWVQSQADAAEKQGEIWASLADRKQSIEQSLAESIDDINADLARTLAGYAYDRAKEEEDFAKDAVKIDKDAADAQLDVQQEFRKDLTDLREDLAKDLLKIQEGLTDALSDIEKDRVKTIYDLERDASKDLEDLAHDRIKNLEEAERDSARNLADVARDSIKSMQDVERDRVSSIAKSQRDAARNLQELTERRDHDLMGAWTDEEKQAINDEYEYKKTLLEREVKDRERDIAERAAERQREIDERAKERREEIEQKRQENRAEIIERANERKVEIEAARAERIQEAQERAAERKVEAEARAKESKKEAEDRARERRKDLKAQKAERLAAIKEQRQERQVELAERRAEAKEEYDRRVQLAKDESAIRQQEAEKQAARAAALADKQAQKELETVQKALAKQEEARNKKFDDENKRFAEQMAKLKTALGDAQAANPMLAALDKLGVKLYDNNGQMRTFNELMPEIMEAFQNLPAGIDASALAMDLFGRNGTKFLDFLRLGAEGFEKNREMAELYGLSLDTELSNSVEQFGFVMNDINLALKGFWVIIGREVLPVLTRFANFFVEHIIPPLLQFARDVAPHVADVLAGIGDAIIALITGDFSKGIFGLKPDDPWVLAFVAVYDKVKTFVDFVIEKAPIVQKALQDLWDKAKPYLDDLKKWFETDGIKAIEDFWTESKEQFDQFQDWLEHDGKDALDEFYKQVERLEPVKNDWVRMMGEMQAAAKEAFTGTKDDADTELPKLEEIVRRVGQNIHGGTTIIMAVWRGIWKGGEQLIHGDFTGFSETVNETVDEMMRGIFEIFDKDWDKTKELFREKTQNIIDFLFSLGGRFNDAAHDMMDGMIQGFRDKAAEVQQALSDIINNAINNILGGLHLPPINLNSSFAGAPSLASGLSGAANVGQLGAGTRIENMTVQFYGENAPRTKAEAEHSADLVAAAMRKGF